MLEQQLYLHNILSQDERNRGIVAQISVYPDKYVKIVTGIN